MSNLKADDDPYAFLRDPPPLVRYKPGVNGNISTTPHIGPPSEEFTLSRVPPRPQNRFSGPNKPRPKTPPLPPLKPIPGGRTAKEGTSFEAPERKIFPQPAVDTSGWEAYGSSEKISSSEGKDRDKTEQSMVMINSGLSSLTLRLRPNSQKNTDETLEDRVSQNPLTLRREKENQMLPDINSLITGGLRSSQDPAVIAAQKAMAGVSKNNASKSRQDSRC